MRRPILFILALFMSFFCFADDVNLIVNGDFESTLDGTWSVVVADGASATVATYAEAVSWSTDSVHRLGVDVTTVSDAPEFIDVYAINNNASSYTVGDSCYLTYYARTEVGGQQIQPMLVSYDAVDAEVTTLVFETRTLEDANNGMKIISAIVETTGTYQFAFACGVHPGVYVIDNVILYSYSPLSLAVVEAQAAYATCIISSSYGYTQTAYDDLKEVCEEAEVFLLQTSITEAESDSVLSLIETALAAFEASYKDEAVLTMYPGYGFTGTAENYKCGYYNGTLGDFEDKGISFKLEKGYMATFAQDVDGLGFSKVYIAQDYALELNFPAELQQSISFLRVSPWFAVGKKGSVGKIDWTYEYNSDWYYNWGMGVPDQNSGYSTPEVQYVPMCWSKGVFWTGSSPVQRVGKNMALNHHMAFNEPDNEGQSNLTVAAALAAYPSLLASGLRLGAPGCENIEYSANNDEFNDGAWIEEFMDSCVARGYRVDFIPAHDYVRRPIATYIERFKGLHDKYGIPIWVTEYNYGNPNMGSEDIEVATGYTYISAMTQAFEDADWIERFNWYHFFGVSTGIGAFDSDGELNITGEFYRDFESSSPSYIQEVYADGPYIDPVIIDAEGNVNYYVETSGDDTNNNGLSESTPFATVSAAFSAISAYYAGHTSATAYVVNVGSGTFTESDLAITNSGVEVLVTIKGEGAKETIIQGAASIPSSNTTMLATSGGDLQITLEDLTVQNYGGTTGGSVGVVTMSQAFDYFTANNCVFRDIQGSDGVLFKTSHKVYIILNDCSFLDINGGDAPIINMGRGYVYVTNCVFSNCVRDYSNVTDDNDKGIILHSQTTANWATADVELVNNTFVNCGVINGNALTTADADQSLVKMVWNFTGGSATVNTVVANNLFCGNTVVGMDAVGYYDITVTDKLSNVIFTDSTNNILNAAFGFPTTDNTINDALVYTSSELDFVMDGDSPELFTTSTGVSYVKANGTSVVEGGLASVATTYDIVGAERATIPSVGAYESLKGVVTAVDMLASEMVQVYPNPVVGGKLHVDYSNLNTPNVVVKMYDLSGHLVYSKGGAPQEIDVLYYPSGMYFMQIATGEGMLNYKVMVKN